MSAVSTQYRRVGDIAAALTEGAAPGSAFLAGGTDLLPLWKTSAAQPERVVDISRLPLDTITSGASGLVIGALARLSAAASHPAVQREAPLITQALLASASGQVRNMATIGGNLLQRTRCSYFRAGLAACNKRDPGSGCGALTGENRQHALFGGSEACVATHPSDLAVALTALDAAVWIESPTGRRRLDLDSLYRSPGHTPERDTTLAAGELITDVDVPAPGRFAAHSHFLKVRDRASFEFAVVSVAAALQIEHGRIVQARLVAGGVASMPWRLSASEAALKGRSLEPAAIAAAAGLASEGAHPLAHNGFKVDLLRRALARALTSLGASA